MWQKRSPSALQFSQFMYGVGCILGPLLVEPYLTGELKSNNTTNSSISTTISTIITTDINETIDRRSKLKLPFIIGGALQSISNIDLRNISSDNYIMKFLYFSSSCFFDNVIRKEI
jgi:hypothetical protein